jgi:hypothetical protein
MTVLLPSLSHRGPNIKEFRIMPSPDKLYNMSPISTLKGQSHVGDHASVICSGLPYDFNKPYIVAEAAETDFCDLKSKFPLNLKIKYQWFNAEGKPLE